LKNLRSALKGYKKISRRERIAIEDLGLKVIRGRKHYKVIRSGQPIPFVTLPGSPCNGNSGIVYYGYIKRTFFPEY
jgi:hypothetical protein